MTNGKPKQQQPAIDIKVETAAPKPARKPRQPRANPKARVHSQAPPATGNGANYADGRNSRRGANNQFRKLAANPAGSNKLSNFAASLVWPAQVPGVRYANVASTVPTALGSPWTQIPAPWSASADPEELSFQAFRSLLRAYSIDYPTNTSPYLYDVLLTNNDRNSKSPPTPSARITIKAEETEDLHSPVAICSTSFKPHGSKVFGGYPGPASRGIRFFWLETSTIVTATLNMETAGTAQDFSFNTVYWSLEDGFETGQNSVFVLTQNVPVTQNITIDSAGWYGFTISNQNPGDRLVDVSISFAGTIRVRGQNACPQLEGRESEIASYRIIGVAQMYENNAAPGARAGSIANYQVPANQDPNDFVTYQQVSGANGAFSEENKDGGYRWLKPTSEALDFSPRDEMVVADGIIYDSHWDLRLPNEFLVQTVSCPAPTGSGNPKSGIWWFYMGLEYESQSTWPQKAYASRNVRQYEDAMLSLQDVPGGCTNKKHTSLLNGFKKALNITEKALNVGKFIAAM